VSSRKYDLDEFVYNKVIHASNPADIVKSVEPTLPGYLRTLDALHRYREFAKVDSGAKLSIPVKAIPPEGSCATCQETAGETTTGECATRTR
jgi:hypothetical protein